MPDGIVTIHFDVSGPVADCERVLAAFGFPVSTSMTAAEQAAEAEKLQSTAGKIVDVADDLKALGKT